jgi:hypothetical protein
MKTGMRVADALPFPGNHVQAVPFRKARQDARLARVEANSLKSTDTIGRGILETGRESSQRKDSHREANDIPGSEKELARIMTQNRKGSNPTFLLRNGQLRLKGKSRMKMKNAETFQFQRSPALKSQSCLTHDSAPLDASGIPRRSSPPVRAAFLRSG